MAIISTSEYKTYAGITDSSLDTVIGNAITSAQADLESYCGRTFDQTSYTDEKYDGTGTPYLTLNNAPVTTLTSVGIIYDGNTETIAATDYRLDANTGRIARIDSSYGRVVVDDFGEIVTRQWSWWPKFPRGFRNVVVTYVAGYTALTMPADLKQIMYEYVDAILARRRADPTLMSETLGAYSYTRKGEQPGMTWVDALYRRAVRYRRAVV